MKQSRLGTTTIIYWCLMWRNTSSRGYCHLTHLSLLPFFLSEVPSRPIHLRAGSVSAAAAPVALPQLPQEAEGSFLYQRSRCSWKCSQGHGGEERTGVFTSIHIHLPQSPPDEFRSPPPPCLQAWGVRGCAGTQTPPHCFKLI